MWRYQRGLNRVKSFLQTTHAHVEIPLMTTDNTMFPTYAQLVNAGAYDDQPTGDDGRATAAQVSAIKIGVNGKPDISKLVAVSKPGAFADEQTEDDTGDLPNPLAVQPVRDLALGWITDYTSLMYDLTAAPREFHQLAGLITAAAAIQRKARLRLAFGDIYPNKPPTRMWRYLYSVSDFLRFPMPWMGVSVTAYPLLGLRGQASTRFLVHSSALLHANSLSNPRYFARFTNDLRRWLRCC